MPGTLGDIFTGSGAPAPPRPGHQVYTNSFNPNEPFAPRDFPSSDMVKQHRVVFETALNAEEGDPPFWYGLPEGRYEIKGGTFHGGGAYPVWRLAAAGHFVAPVTLLLEALAAVPADNTSDLILGQVYHSHWKGLKGGALDYVAIVNQGAGGGPGTGGRSVVHSAEQIAMILALEPDNLERTEWLAAVRKTLTSAE